jgi:hypothetical protein
LKPFRDNLIDEARRLKRRAERRYKKTGSTEDKATFNAAVKNVANVVKAVQNKFFSEKLKNVKGNAKETYKIVNYLLNKTKEKMLPDYNDTEKLVNDFATFFFDKTATIRRNLPQSSTVHYSNDISEKVKIISGFSKFEAISVEEFDGILNSVKKKYSSLDDIPVCLINPVLKCGGPLLLNIMNQSLLTGVFPSDLKLSHITPIIKNKSLDKNILTNYRPVSIGPLISKFIEKGGLSQLNRYLLNNDLVMTEQSAYKQHHSCETALAKIYDDLLSGLDAKTSIIMVFLDYSAAFDTIDQNLLLLKLQNEYGVTGTALKWFTSYLKDRYYQVKINNHLSEPKPLLYGIPQGSVLGPILFTLYTQEVKMIIKRHNFDFHVFADDLQLYFHYTGETSELFQLNACLKDIKKWSEDNFLQLNERKTNVINITVKGFDYKINNIRLMDENFELLTCAKNLGFIIDERLSFDQQITSVCKKGFAMLRSLWRISSRINNVALKTQLVHSCILAQIDYCNSMYCDLPEKSIKRLQRLMNASVRFIFNIARYDNVSITDLLKKCHLLPVKLRIQFKVCLLVYKCFHAESPEYLQNLIEPKKSLESLRVSSDTTLIHHPQLSPQNYKNRKFSAVAPKYWNELPRHIRESPSLPVFKSRLKTFLFNSY